LDKEKKIQIIKAAVKRFTKHGLNKTTLDEVARDLRIGKATIYHYFQSKEDLYYKTLLFEISLYIDEIKSLLNNEAKIPQEIIFEYIELKENTAGKYRLIFELLLHILTGTQIEPEIQCLQELFKEENAVVKEFFKRIAKKDNTGDLPEFLAEQSWGLLFGGILKNTAYPPKETDASIGTGQSFKKESLIKELESFFAGKTEDKK